MAIAEILRKGLDAVMGRKVAPYITLFGWTKSDFRVDATLSRLIALLGQDRSGKSEWLVGFDGEERSIAQVGLTGVRNAIIRPNVLVPGETGTLFKTRDGTLSLLLNWTRPEGEWIGQVFGTASLRHFQTREAIDEFVQIALRLGEALQLEYLIAADSTEEKAQVASLPLPRYENNPGQGIPYVPWLLVLNQRLARHLPETLPPPLHEYHSSEYLAIAAGATPSEWRTRSSQQARAKLKELLGATITRPVVRNEEG